MDRLVEIKVKYGTAVSDSKFIGVVGDAFITAMRVTFDADWDGFAKTLTMWDARGQNPVAVLLGANLLEDVAVGNVYLVPIPAEPLARQGDGIAAVFEGTKTLDGVTTVQRTENLYFTVLEASVADGAGAPSDVTPSQAEQLQSEIEGILPTLRADLEAAQAAHDGAEGALTAAEWAQAAAEEALSGAAAAKDGALAAKAASEAGAAAALAAKSAIEAMTATVSGLPAGTAPTVTKSTAAGVTNFAFAVPEGERGEQGPQGYSVYEVVKTSGTGAAGSADTYAVKLNDAAATVAGTFTVQNGADGEGAGDMLMSLYDSNGDGVVNDADKLGGELPAYYATGAGLAAHTGSTSNPHAVTAAQAGAAAASHTHAASAITSGTLAVARGGTGNTSVDTAPTSGSTKMVTSGGVYTATQISQTTYAAIEAAVGAALSGDTLNNALAAIASVIGTNGMQVETGSYVGTGTGGSEAAATTITFGIAPKFLLVAAGGNTGVFALFSLPVLTTSFTEFAYRPDGTLSNYVRAKKSSDGKTVYFYVASSYGSYIRLQANTSGVTYHYVAIG